MFVTFISIHLVIVCVVLLWCTYETHPTLPLKSGCDTSLAWLRHARPRLDVAGFIRRVLLGLVHLPLPTD
jgi:hypothetical protein